jgi:hypothetical protein
MYVDWFVCVCIYTYVSLIRGTYTEIFLRKYGHLKVRGGLDKALTFFCLSLCLK